MAHKVPFIVKGVPTDRAAVRWCQTRFPASAPDSRHVVGLVAADVSPQFCTLAEAFPTDFAAEGRWSIVSLHVSLQRASVAELFAADGAAEWLLRRVDPHVRHHVALLVEDFATDVAAEGFLSGMQPQVCLLSSDRGELLATNVTGPAAVAVRLKVQPQTIAGLQTFTAQTAETLRLLQVFLYVFHQEAFPVEGLPAHSAAVRRHLFIILTLFFLASRIVRRSRLMVRFRDVVWSGGSAGQRFLQSVVHRDAAVQMFLL